MSTIKQKAEEMLEEKNKNCVPENIREGATIFGVQGNFQANLDTTDATATASDIEIGKTAYVKETKVTGTLPKQNTIEFTNNNITNIQESQNNNSNDYVEVTATNSTKQIVDKDAVISLKPKKSVLANGINLTDDKIQKGNTILGIEGNAGMLNADYETCIGLADDILGTETEEGHIYGVKRYINSQSPKWGRTDESSSFRADINRYAISHYSIPSNVKAIQTGINDFDNIYPWSKMRLCNYNTSTNTIDAYIGDPNFTYSPTDVSIQLMVDIPKFYYRCFIDDENYVHYQISTTKKDTFSEYKRRLVSAVNLKSNNQKAHSTIASNYYYLVNTKWQTNKISQIGNNTTTLDYETLGGIQILFLIEYASFDITEFYLLMGDNIVDATRDDTYGNNATQYLSYFGNKTCSFEIYNNTSHSSSSSVGYLSCYRGIMELNKLCVVGGYYFEDVTPIDSNQTYREIMENLYYMPDVYKNKNKLDTIESSDVVYAETLNVSTVSGTSQTWINSYDYLNNGSILIPASSVVGTSNSSSGTLNTIHRTGSNGVADYMYILCKKLFSYDLCDFNVSTFSSRLVVHLD